MFVTCKAKGIGSYNQKDPNLHINKYVWLCRLVASPTSRRTRLYLHTSQWLQLTVTVVGQTIYWAVFRRSMTRHVFRTINCLRYVVPNDSSSPHSAYNPVRLPWFIPLWDTSCLCLHTPSSRKIATLQQTTGSNETPRRHTVSYVRPPPAPAVPLFFKCVLHQLFKLWQ